jgi:hypothetical protein
MFARRRTILCAVLIHGFTPAIAFATELPICLTGNVDSPTIARIREELTALGYIESVQQPCIDVHVQPDDGSRFGATVTTPERVPVRVVVDATVTDAMGVFALRIAEAVSAAHLSPSHSTVQVPTPTVDVRSLGATLGVRVLAAPGGVDPMVLPMVRVRWGRRAFAVLVFSAPSWGGNTSEHLALSAISLGLGGGYAFQIAAIGRWEVAAHMEYLALSLANADTGQSLVRDGVFDVHVASAFCWPVVRWMGFRVGATAGVTLSQVDVGIGTRVVAQWGRALLGAEVGAEFVF